MQQEQREKSDSLGQAQAQAQVPGTRTPASDLLLCCRTSISVCFVAQVAESQGETIKRFHDLVSALWRQIS